MNKFSLHYKSLTVMALFLVFSIPVSAQFDDDFLVTNSAIFDMVRDNDNLYIGGYFTYVGPNTGKAVLLDYNDATYNSNFPKVNGNVYACVSDNNGGWFIGGDFTKVGSEQRLRLAHITSSGSVSSWNPGANGSVRTLFLYGSTLYVGGYFSIIGGVNRNFAGSVDAITGVTTAWNPDPDGSVWAITADNNFVYIGGLFNNVNVTILPIPRANLARVSNTTGVVDSWICNIAPYDVSLPFAVYGLQLSDNNATLYVWGNISNIGGQIRRGVGRVNTSISNSVQSWNPNVLKTSSTTIAGTVYSVVITDGDTVFIGGLFSRIRTTSTVRNNIAAVTKSGTPTVYSWNPNIYADWYDPSLYRPQVNCIQVSGESVYAGGRFNLVGSSRRHNLAEISRSTGLVTSWDPHVSDSYFNGGGEVFTLLTSVNGLFAGGEFPSVNGKTRKGVAKINLQTKTLSDWDPKLGLSWGWDPQLQKLAVHGSTVFLGGDFDSVGGQYQKTLAAVDANTGQLQSFLSFTNITTPISLLKVKNSKLYVSGNFTGVGDSTRNRAACIDLTNNQVTAWNPQLTGGGFYELIHSMAFSDSAIFIGGDFSAVRGVSRGGLAAVDYNLGAPTSWDPNFGGTQIYPLDIEVNNSLVYIAGGFSQVGTTSRNCLASIDFNGNVTSWNPNVQGSLSIKRIRDIEIAGSNVYAGGDFYTINGITRKFIASIDINSGIPTSWNPQIQLDVHKIQVDKNQQTVYFGGEFGNVDNNHNIGLARYMDSSIQTSKTLNLTALIEGFYDGTSMVSDTVTVELRNATAPYGLVESKQMVLNTSGNGTANFTSAAEATSYYIVVKHRNALETWSKTPQSFSGGTLNYDFTTAATQAYGDNLKPKSGKWCMFSGDIQPQDDLIDLTDVISVTNDANFYIFGIALLTDLNGDQSVDLTDILLVLNNANSYVSAQQP